MFTITRSLARHLRAVFRRAGIKSRGGVAPPITFHAGPAGVRIRALSPEVALEYHSPDSGPEEEIAAPISLLDDCHGKGDGPVTIEARPNNKVVAVWYDQGIPQHSEYGAPEIRWTFPPLPDAFHVVKHSLWQALRNAAECADCDSLRYALQNIQLRGEEGLVTAADGHQLFQQSGFEFPWSGEVMIPALGVLGCSELAALDPIEIGRTETTIGIRIARWTLLLTIDATGRFPRLDEVFAGAESGTTTIRLSPEDAIFLAQALPRLPHSVEAPDCPVTLDLEGHVSVRARGTSEEAPITELVLSGTSAIGEPLRLEMNRKYLERALKLGLTEVRLRSPDKAIMAFDAGRKYIWMPLSPEGALGPAVNAIFISAGAEGGTTSIRTIRSEMSMSQAINVGPQLPTTPSTTSQAELNPAASAAGPINTESVPSTPTAGSFSEPSPAAAAVRRSSSRKKKAAAAGPIEQAVTLRNALRESVGAANELIRALKRQRQQSRLVQTTLASLKELQRAG